MIPNTSTITKKTTVKGKKTNQNAVVLHIHLTKFVPFFHHPTLPSSPSLLQPLISSHSIKDSRYIKQIQSNPPTRRPQQKYLTPSLEFFPKATDFREIWALLSICFLIIFIIIITHITGILGKKKWFPGSFVQVNQPPVIIYCGGID